MKAFDEKRLGIVRVDAERIMTLLNLGINPRQFLLLPVTDRIPADAQVVSVHSDYGRRAIELIICSEQLPPLEPGQQAPYLSDTFVDFKIVDLDAIARRNKPQVVVVTDQEDYSQALYVNGELVHTCDQAIYASDIVSRIGNSLMVLEVEDITLGKDEDFPTTIEGVRNHHSRRSVPGDARTNEGHHDSATIRQSDDSSAGGTSGGSDSQTV